MLKVSVIIPVYGVEAYIEKCARSIFEQTYSNLEILFVNDCTPDNSIQIIKELLDKYPDRKKQVKILSQDKNRGVSAARQVGLETLSGDYCIQFDSDDYIAPTMIEELVQTAVREEADVVFCDYNLVKSNEIIHIHTNPSLNHIQCVRQFLEGELYAFLWNKLIRVCFYKDYHIQFIEGLNMREDLSVMYRLLYFANKIAYIPKPLYFYVMREGSISSTIMNKKQQRNAQELIEQMVCFFVHENIQDKKLLDALIYFKAQIKSTILLFGNVNELKNELYKDVKWYHYYSHPQIIFFLKAIGVLSCFGFTPLVNGYRMAFHGLSKFKRMFIKCIHLD